MASRYRDYEYGSTQDRSVSPSYSPPRRTSARISPEPERNVNSYPNKRSRSPEAGSSRHTTRPTSGRRRSRSSERRRSRSSEQRQSTDRPRSSEHRSSRERKRSKSSGRRRSRERQRSRSNKRLRSSSSDSRRSRSKDMRTSNIKLKRESRDRSRSPCVQRNPFPKYSQEEIEAIKSLNCLTCSVKLHDKDSMKMHIDGKRHLAQKQKHADNMLRKRFGVGLSESMTTKKEHFGVDEGFWLRNESKDKQQMYYKDPELKRVHDDKRYDLMKSNFKGAKNYDRGQFKENMKDLYCELCGVTVATRDIMESHKQGKEHMRQAKEHARYECKICLIVVPCQDTLNNHMRGKDHIKKENQIKEEQRRNKRIFGTIKPEPGVEDRERLKQLLKDNETLKTAMAEANGRNRDCLIRHGGELKICKLLEKLENEIWELEGEKEQLTEKIERIKAEHPTGSVKKEESDVKNEFTEDSYLLHSRKSPIVLAEIQLDSD